MKASELRIGNIAMRCGFLFEERKKFSNIIVSSNDILACFISPESFKPIPLTEDWLIKFGGEKTKQKMGTQATYIIEGIKFDVSHSGNVYHAQFNKPVRYVHKLQNLVYELKDVELTIEL